jgi:PEP-CTERM motif
VATKNLIWMAITVIGICLTLGQRSASADDIVNLKIDTSSLSSLAGSEVFFILTGTGANTANLTNIALGGGSAGAVDTAATSGGTNASDSLASGISLNDSANFLTVFAQTFLPGSALSFQLDLTTNVVSPIPDQFSMEIVDPNGNLIPTSDPTGFDNLFAINIDSPNPATNIYSSLVTVTAPIPEPSSLLLIAAGLLAIALLCRRQKSARI